jgi:multidrug efflux pump subunit AcrA (membrane-fusion protein)
VGPGATLDAVRAVEVAGIGDREDFRATLREILPQGGNQEYSVILILNQPPDRLLPGMTGEINIILGKHQNVLIIPSRAVRSIGNRTSVYLVENDIVEITLITKSDIS